MSIKLISNYSKKLGLPGYSSHCFGVTIETELNELGEVHEESSRIYQLLQDAVDCEIQHSGFLPVDQVNGSQGDSHTRIGASHRNTSANGSDNGSWKCSEKQRDLILKLVDEHRLDRDEVDHLARQRFGKSVRALGKIEASGLIDELIETHGKKVGGGSPRSSRRNAYAKGGVR